MRPEMARGLAIAIALLAVTCSIAVDYDPEQDNLAMSHIEQLWSDNEYEGGLELVLCEDRIRADAAVENECGVEHIVKGGGRGSNSGALRGGNDCSGCPYQAIAYVQGVIGGGDLGATFAVQGVVIFDDYNDPYRRPYTLELQCVDENEPCDVTGEILESGWINLSVSREGLSSLSNVTLSAGGEIECVGD